MAKMKDVFSKSCSVFFKSAEREKFRLQSYVYWFLPPEEAVWRKMVSALMLFSAESGYILQKTNVDNTVERCFDTK